MKWRPTYMHLLPAAALAALVSACASIGRPEGGPRDEMPPKFVRANPAPGQLNVTNNKITVVFDENIQLDDAFNKVVVSPVQTQPPAISSNARSVTVELRDTLKPNATYSIDFADAIKDLNEGNVLDGFAIDFATGDTIDTLRISGIVLEARNLEPAQGMLVGVHSNLDDSALTTLPFDRIARTNQYGQFTIRNLKPGNYRVFALNDLNRDYRWDRSEDVAFYDYTVLPSIENIEVCDTFLRQDGTDSLVAHPGIKYLPNDVLLTWFNEGYSAQYLKDYKRPERRKIILKFAAESDTLPTVTIANGPQAGRGIDDWALAQVNDRKDSLIYWIRDTTVLNTDSLQLAVGYFKTDSNEQLAWKTDTLRFYYRDPKPSKKKNKDEKEDTDSVITDAFGVPQPKEFLSINIGDGQQDVYLPLTFTSEQPIDTIKNDMVHLDIQVDTVWNRITDIKLEPDSLEPLLKRNLHYKWEPGAKYRVTLDSTAITGIYGLWTKPTEREFSVKPLEEYSNLIFNITGLEADSTGQLPPVVVELLGTNDDVKRTVSANDGRAVFNWIEPGAYYARLYIDTNGNGKWDSGEISSKTQPEEVYYYSKKLQLKKNWDIEQSWDIYELTIDTQKPMAIKKNKPKPKKGEKFNQGENDEDEYDEFGNPIDPNNPNTRFDPYDPSNINNRRPGNGLRNNNTRR